MRSARGVPTALRDPRLSRAGNWLAKQLTQTLEGLTRMENWLRTLNERELHARDRELLQPLLQRAAGRGEPGGGAVVRDRTSAWARRAIDSSALRHEIVQRQQAGTSWRNELVAARKASAAWRQSGRRFALGIHLNQRDTLTHAAAQAAA